MLRSMEPPEIRKTSAPENCAEDKCVKLMVNVQWDVGMGGWEIGV